MKRKPRARGNRTPGNALFSFSHWQDRATVNAYAKAMANREAATPAGFASTFQIIDTKATGLLTHVSLMIAGLGICASIVADNHLEMSVIIFQISAYLLIAVGCLRCLSVLSSFEASGDAEEMRHEIARELMLRQELYRLCNRASIFFTVIVFLSLPLMLFWKP
jgi:hypothetical protein